VRRNGSNGNFFRDGACINDPTLLAPVRVRISG
jgi:hypothetical protein